MRRAPRLVRAHRRLAGMLGLTFVLVSCGGGNKIDRSPTLDPTSRPAIATPTPGPSSSSGQPHHRSVPPATATPTPGSVGIRGSDFRLPSAKSRAVAAALGSRILV